MDTKRIYGAVIVLSWIAYADRSDALSFKPKTIEGLTTNVQKVLNNKGHRADLVKVTNVKKTFETGAPNLFKAEWKSEGQGGKKGGTVYFTPSSIEDGLLLITKVQDTEGQNIYAYDKRYPVGPEIANEIRKQIGPVQIISEMARGEIGPGEHIVKAVKAGFGNIPPADAFYNVVVRYDLDANKYRVSKIFQGEHLEHAVAPFTEKFAVFGKPSIKDRVMEQVPGKNAVYENLNDIIRPGSSAVDVSQLEDLMRSYLGGSKVNFVTHKYNIPTGTFDTLGKRKSKGFRLSEVKLVDPYGDVKNPLNTLHVTVARTEFGTIPVVVKNHDGKVLFALGAVAVKPKESETGGEISEIYDQTGNRVIPPKIKQPVVRKQTPIAEKWEDTGNEWLEYYQMPQEVQASTKNGTP